MALHISSLNSGSNGNCYYLANEQDAILVDAGLNCRETEKRMDRLGLSMNKVRAVFISHEHSDHIRGLPVLARKYQVPVYITPGTMSGGRLQLREDLVRAFRCGDCIQIGEIRVTAFAKLHDACEPHSFMASCRDVNVGIFTDIGYPCENLIHYFKQCHAAFLEANYDEDMLDRGRYPYFLKNRIRGGKGHLSNRQALELFKLHKSPSLSHLILAHLSRDNNSPELVSTMFSAVAGKTKIIVASRDRESEILYVGKDGIMTDVPAPKMPVQRDQVQYSLFG